MFSQHSIRKKALAFFDKHGILLAGVLIFAYYLWSTLDVFASPSSSRSFTTYFFHFDSVILLWMLLFVGAKLYDHKKKQKEEQEKERQIVLEYERKKMQLDLLDEVSTLLSDAINNPLAIISLSAGSIRERFASDVEVIAFLDNIDGALKRMREVLYEFQNYQSKKIIKSSQGTSQYTKEEHTSSRVPTDSVLGTDSQIP
jgi:signal transduction histidine kinase